VTNSNVLHRSTDDRVLAGVCGGIGKHLKIDPTIVRILWVLFSLFYLTGLIVYIILALVIPEGPQTASDMTSEILLEYMSQRFPEWSKIAIHNFQDITSGWETEILAFDVMYTHSEKSEKHAWILRAYSGTSGSDIAKYEYGVYKILHSLEYPVPLVILVETDTCWVGKPFIIMDRIIGHTVQNFIQSGDEEDRLRIIKEMSMLNLKLHQIDWSKASGIPEKYYTVKPKDMFLQRIDGNRNWISSRGVEYLLPLVDWLQLNHDKISFDRYSILHGDFHPMNVLVDTEGNYFVIDWTSARLGDYRSDLAWSMLVAFIYNDNEYWQFILQEYESAAGEKVEDMDYFMVDAAMGWFALILISLRDGAESMGVREDSTEMMRSTLPLLTKLHDLVEKITGVRIKEIDDQINKDS